MKTCDAIDWYNYEEVEKLQNTRAKKYLGYVKKMIEARGKGDEKALLKAYASMSKHRRDDEAFKEKAEEAGFCWV